MKQQHSVGVKMESISHYTPFLLLLLAAGDIVFIVEEQRRK